MSYSIDANILIYASNQEDPHNPRAIEFLKSRARDPDLLCMTWPAIFSYLRIVTHPSIFSTPLNPEAAQENIKSLIDSPRCHTISEEPGFLDTYLGLTEHIHVRGNLVPDAHIAAILRQHGVHRIYTADTDFRKFDFLQVINPLTNPKD